MMARHARPGRIEAIFLRPARREDVQAVDHADIAADGLVGDHAPGGKRAVTLIQAEHLAVVAALLGKASVDPGLLRRNIVVSGVNLLAVRKHEIDIGAARLLIAGPCPPCSRMEEVLGYGGYSAMRGHGGVYAEVIDPGRIAVGDSVARADAAEPPAGIF